MAGRSPPSRSKSLSNPCRVREMPNVRILPPPWPPQERVFRSFFAGCSTSAVTYSTVDTTGTARLLRTINANQFITPRAPSVARDAHAAPCHEYRGTR